uniref:Uncharacterized protein n=1 Tax=Oryza sativa subsp. japonica TaxID=39947 RepID=Q69M38_ORYSJ|nr:hypothetical protein [Oryza sativa Japonica Group]
MILPPFCHVRLAYSSDAMDVTTWVAEGTAARPTAIASALRHPAQHEPGGGPRCALPKCGVWRSIGAGVALALQRRRVRERCGPMGLGAKVLLKTLPPQSHLTGCRCGCGVRGECETDLVGRSKNHTFVIVFLSISFGYCKIISQISNS